MLYITNLIKKNKSKRYFTQYFCRGLTDIYFFSIWKSIILFIIYFSFCFIFLYFSYANARANEYAYADAYVRDSKS